MRVFWISGILFLLILSGCKKAESFKIGSLGEAKDLDVQITNVIQPASNLPILYVSNSGTPYIYYHDSSGELKIKIQNHILKLSEELKDATLGGLRLKEDEENIYAFYWARYAKEDMYKSSQEEIRQRKEEFKEELSKRQAELKSIAEEKKRIARETPEERKRKEEFKKEVEKIKSKYPDLKSEDIEKRKEAYNQFIKEVSEKRKALLGDIERRKKEKLEELRAREMQIRSEIERAKGDYETKVLLKNIFVAVIDKKNFSVKSIKITSDRFFPTADISVGNKDNLMLLAWTDEKVEGSIGVCYTISRDKALNWSEPRCLKGYIHPRVIDKGGNLFLSANKCNREQCEYKVLLVSQEGIKEVSTLKTSQSEIYLDVAYNGKEYHIYTWGPESFTVYSTKDLSQFKKLADSSSITVEKSIQMLLPVSADKPRAILTLKPKIPKSWVGINLDKPNIYLVEFSDGKAKLTRLQRNTEHLTTATNPAVGTNSRGDVAVVWIDKRFLVPVPFVTFITKEGKIYSDNPLEDPRHYTVDQPSVISVGEEFIVYYPIKKVGLEEETAKDIYSKPYFERVRKLKVTPVEYAFESPSKDSLEKAFKDYAQARVKNDEKKYYQYFDPIFRLRLPYELWKAQKVDIKFKDVSLKKAEILDHFGQVVYQAHVEFPEQIGKIMIKEKEKKYEAIDEVWVYLFGKWYYVPRTPISSIFYAEW